MDLNCSEVTLTWYPGSPGDTADPLTLLSTSHLVEPGSTLAAQVSQLVQTAEFVRGDAVDHYPRGNKRTSLTWTEVREIADPMVALETALAREAGLPALRGWMSINLARRDTSWKVVPAVIRGISHRHDEFEGLLYLSYSVECGALSILLEGEEPPPIYAPGELMEGPAVNRGAILLGPNRTYPAA